MRKTNKGKLLIILGILLVTLSSCSVYKTFVNMSRLKFKLNSVQNFRVLNYPVNNKTSLKDFSPIDLINLTASVATGKLPVSFTLIVDAKNPNTGNGYSSTDITIEDFPWKLYVNGKETVSGRLEKPVTVPGMGEVREIPLEVKFDLLKIFKNKSLDDIINLALTIGGAKGSPSHLKLVAEPVLGTPIGKMKYPEPITIVSQKFQ